MQIQPLSQDCQVPYQKQEHICFGISPFNSLFSEEYLVDLAKFGLKNFESFHFFIPDDPTIYTLEALGYSESDARKKMKKQINWLKNKMIKALLKVGVEPSDHIIDWKYLSSNPVFVSELEAVTDRFATDPDFKSLCLNASRWVLQNKIEEEKITEECLLKAVKYFLAEVPMFAATNKILGKSSSLFCYHQSIDFHHKLYQCELDYRPHEGQGYGRIVH